jgi:branched-subunit amino acid aminotransferase/4-amino-4-deoxychorismate lyase
MEKEMPKRAPFEAAFTTLPWDGELKVRSAKLHMLRLKKHAEALSIPWPNAFSEDLRFALNVLSEGEVVNSQSPHELDDNEEQGVMSANGDGENIDGQPPFLLRVEIDEMSNISLTGRPNRKTRNHISGIIHPAPNWPKSIQGIKHADWTPYAEAGLAARKAGAQVALLAREGEIIDGDRASPILLDIDGTAWVVSPERGAIPSTTLELVIPAIEAQGIPVRKGRLTEVMFARAHEVLLLGSGLTAVRLTDIDGQNIGIDAKGEVTKSILLPICLQAIIDQGWTDFNQWVEDVGL